MSSTVCVCVSFRDSAMCTRAAEVCRSVPGECQECQCNSNFALLPEASTTWAYILYQKWGEICVISCVHSARFSMQVYKTCILSSISLPLPLKLSSPPHVRTCGKAKQLQCFSVTVPEHLRWKHNLTDLPAVLTRATPPESSSQALVSLSLDITTYLPLSPLSLPPCLAGWLFHGSLFSLSSFDKDWRNNYSWA